MSNEEDVRDRVGGNRRNVGQQWSRTALWLQVFLKNTIHTLQRDFLKRAKIIFISQRGGFWPVLANFSNVSIHRLLFYFVSVFLSDYPCFWVISLPRNLWPSFQSDNTRLLGFGSKFCSLLPPRSWMSDLNSVLQWTHLGKGRKCRARVSNVGDAGDFRRAECLRSAGLQLCYLLSLTPRWQKLLLPFREMLDLRGPLLA